MKYLISLYLWIVGIFTFSLFMFMGVLFTFIFPPERYDPWIKKMMRIFINILHISVEVKNIPKFESNTPYLFMANHVSLFDLPILAGYIPIFFRGVAAQEQFSWFLYGWFIRRYGNIPIDRQNVHSSIVSIRKAEKFLRAGKSITILPEGHRTMDGKLGRFKKLPFFLAQKAEVAIVPIGLSGLYKLKSKNSWLIRPTTVILRFGEIIPVEKVKSLSNKELKEYTRQVILRLIDEEEKPSRS